MSRKERGCNGGIHLGSRSRNLAWNVRPPMKLGEGFKRGPEEVFEEGKEEEKGCNGC